MLNKELLIDPFCSECLPVVTAVVCSQRFLMSCGIASMKVERLYRFLRLNMNEGIFRGSWNA